MTSQIESESFEWEKWEEGTYTVSVDKHTLVFQGNPARQYFCAIGNKGFTNGKHYWRVHASCDNIRVGIAGPRADASAPIGSDENSWCVNLQTGDVWHRCADMKNPPASALVTRLYKLLVPISGGMVGLLLDMEEGRLSLFFNEEYQGVMLSDPDLKSKGPIYPCVGIGGLEGKTVTIPTTPARVPKIYAYKRNKI